MTFTLKNHEMIGLYLSIQEVINSQIKLPVKTAWNLSKNLSKIQRILEDYSITEKRIIEEYGEKDDDGNIIYNEKGQPKIKDGQLPNFNKDHGELLNCQSEVELLTINLDDLLYTKDTNGEVVDREIKPSIIYNLSLLINE